MKHFAISLTGTYTRDEIPPRCRKPRPVTYETSAQVEVPMVSSGDAPVAFLVRDLDDEPHEIRTHDGRLFAPYLPWARQTEPSLPGSLHFPQDVDTERHSLRHVAFDVDSDEAFYKCVAEHYRRFLIIDGVVWVEGGEPSYSVNTFGMGHNHGGTGLMVNAGAADGHSGKTFRADEFEAAHAHAIETAADRGDTEDVARFKRNPESYRRIEVLIPEAVTLVTIAPVPKAVGDLRFEYSLARDYLSRATSLDEEAERFAEVVRLREEIIKQGYSPIKSDAQPYEARHGAGEGL